MKKKAKKRKSIKNLVELGRDIGAIAGVIYLIFIYLFISIPFASSKESTFAYVDFSPNAFSEFLGLLMFLVSGAIYGTFWGTIFVVIHKKLPGKKPLEKGIVYALILWIIGLLLNIGYFGLGEIPLPYYVIITLIANLIFGILVGYYSRNYYNKGLL